MDAFTRVKKSSSFLSPPKPSIPSVYSSMNTGVERTSRISRQSRVTPYSKQERAARLERIKAALEDPLVELKPAAKVDPVHDSPSSGQSTSLGAVQLPSTANTFSSHTNVNDHHTKNASSNPPSSKTAISSAPLTRKDVMNMRLEANPIVHSKAPSKSQYITSCASGHEREQGPSGSPYWVATMNSKLSVQAVHSLPPDSSKGIDANLLLGLRIYVDGLVRGTTRSEITRLVAMHGGINLRAAQSATHIISSTGLSGTKSRTVLKSGVKKSNSLHVVKPEWLYDSLNAGKRLREYDYRVVTSSIQSELV
ncbi:hypothetical protein DL93DRAFT_2076052 [Clavulina sp. PMI_390]|nr:hypothetical protein DL93DRAFT_2076052 [Clavulina sp. PMI_390]